MFPMISFSIMFLLLMIKYNSKILDLKNRVEFLEDRFSLVYSLLENKNAK
jgi:hypothetical protein